METEKNILVTRHLEDVDDLTKNGDSGINPEKTIEAYSVAEKIIEEVRENDKKGVLFISSPKKRVQETVSVIREKIREKSILKTMLYTDEALREIDQGIFNLPEGYKSGDFIPELDNAWKFFWHESFELKNLDYKFGDKFYKDGCFKYPELNNFFSSTGENYREFSLRLYKAALRFSKNKKLNSNQNFQIVIMTHSAPIAIYKELESIALDIVNNGASFKIGELIPECHKRYLERRKKEPSTKFGEVDTLNIDHLLDEEVQIRLTQEIEFLESKNNRNEKNI